MKDGGILGSVMTAAVVATALIIADHLWIDRPVAPVAYVTNAVEVIDELQAKALAGKIDRERFLKMLGVMEQQLAEMSHDGRVLVFSRSAVLAGGHEVIFSVEDLLAMTAEQEPRGKIADQEGTKEK